MYMASLTAGGAGGAAAAGAPAALMAAKALDDPAAAAQLESLREILKKTEREFGSRPEDLVVSSGPGLVAEVRLVEVLGSEQHVYFWLDATPAAQAAAASAAADEAAEAAILMGGAPNGMARVEPHTPVKPGGRVTFTVDPARLYFFDPDTGEAITG